MKNCFKLIGLIAIVALTGLSMTACDLFTTSEESTGVTVNVTGNFNDYIGWKADISFQSSGAEFAAGQVNSVTASSLSFAMFYPETSKPFETAGTYTVFLFFRKTGEDDVIYAIESKSIKQGLNTIALSTFTLISDGDDNGDEGIPEELIGTWIKDDNDSIKWVITDESFTIEYTFAQIIEIELFDIISYKGTTVTLKYEFDDDPVSFHVYISDSKLVINGSPDGHYDGTYTNEDNYDYSDSEWLAVDWEELGITGGLKQPEKTYVDSVDTENGVTTVILGIDDVTAIRDAFYDLYFQMSSKEDGWEYDGIQTSPTGIGGYASYKNDAESISITFTYYSDYDDETDSFTEQWVKIVVGPYQE